MRTRFREQGAVAPAAFTTPEPVALPGRWWRGTVLGLLGLAGCGGLDPIASHEAVTDPAALFMALTLEARAINLTTAAPYNTIQLVATPRDAHGEAMTGLPAPTFRLATPDDSTLLRVTPDGQMTALAPASRIDVIAELVAPGPVRHADTARVNVTPDPPPVVDRFSIDPSSSGNAMWPIGNDPIAFLFFGGAPNQVPMPQVLDPTGQPIAGLVVEYASLDPARATVDRWTGRATTLRLGPVPVVARTTAYGVTKADTALFTVTWTLVARVYSTLAPDGTRIFYPGLVWVSPHGFVFWQNELSSDSVDVTFDDPTNVADAAPAPICLVFPSACGTGNVLLPEASEEASERPNAVRRFPIPGVYTYHSTRTGATGRIIVTDELPAEAGTP